MGQGGQHVAVAPGAAGRPAQRVESSTRHDRVSWPGTADQHPQHDPCAQRVATEVVVIESEPVDQCQPIIGQDIGRVGPRVVRACAVAVAAQIRKDDAVSVLGNSGRGTVMDPLQRGGRETMKQHQGPTVPHLTVDQFQAIPARKSVHGWVSHAHSIQPNHRTRIGRKPELRRAAGAFPRVGELTGIHIHGALRSERQDPDQS